MVVSSESTTNKKHYSTAGDATTTGDQQNPSSFASHHTFMQRPVSVNSGDRGFAEELNHLRWSTSAENNGGASLVSPASFLDQFSVCPEALLSDPARPRLLPAACYDRKVENEPLRSLLPDPPTMESPKMDTGNSGRQEICDDFYLIADRNEDDSSADDCEDDSIKQQKKIDAATLLAFETQQRLLRDYLSMPTESGGEAASRLPDEQYVRALVPSQHRVLAQQQPQPQPTKQSGAESLLPARIVDTQDRFSLDEFNGGETPYGNEWWNGDGLGNGWNDLSRLQVSQSQSAEDDAISIASSGSFSIIGTKF